MLHRKNIAASILAGGKAKRLGGIAKGNLIINNDKTIIQHLLNAIKAAHISQTIIIANDATAYKNYGTKIIDDLWDDVGPLAGIASALNYYTQHDPQYENILILPCDLPNITSEEIIHLVNSFYSQNKQIVFAVTSSSEKIIAENIWHPLCAVVSCSILPQLQQAITKHQYKVRHIWQAIGATSVMFTCNKNFHNINTHIDIENKK